MKFHTDSSRSSPTQAPSHTFPGAVSHGLIPKQSYTNFFSYISRWSFTCTHPEEALPRLLLIHFQMQFHTDSSRSSHIQAPSHKFLDAVSHGLIPKQPYPGSFSYISKWIFTRTYHEANLHRFLLFLRWSFILTHHEATLYRFLLRKFQMQFYTDSSSEHPTPVPSLFKWSFTLTHPEETLPRFHLIYF